MARIYPCSPTGNRFGFSDPTLCRKSEQVGGNAIQLSATGRRTWRTSGPAQSQALSCEGADRPMGRLARTRPRRQCLGASIERSRSRRARRTAVSADSPPSNAAINCATASSSPRRLGAFGTIACLYRLRRHSILASRRCQRAICRESFANIPFHAAAVDRQSGPIFV
jgi:hypothetical protein